MDDDLACERAVEQLTEYMEGALPGAERQRLEAHLRSCEPCTEYLAQLRLIAGSLGGLRRDPGDL